MTLMTATHVPHIQLPKVLPFQRRPAILGQSCEHLLTRSLREPGGPCTKSLEVSESRMERVKTLIEHLKCYLDFIIAKIH